MKSAKYHVKIREKVHDSLMKDETYFQQTESLFNHLGLPHISSVCSIIIILYYNIMICIDVRYCCRMEYEVEYRAGRRLEAELGSKLYTGGVHAGQNIRISDLQPGGIPR